jgi:hypothetical protein
MRGRFVGLCAWFALSTLDKRMNRRGMPKRDTGTDEGTRKLFAHLGWSYQCGRKLYIRRDPVDQLRYELGIRSWGEPYPFMTRT